MTAPRLEALDVADDAEDWRALGFSVGAQGAADVGGVRLRLVGRRAGEGLVAWALRGVGAAELDGLDTRPPDDTSPGSGEHPNGAMAVDHVVVATPNLERTLGALGEAGLVPRRLRDAGRARQAFVPAGTALLEVVGPLAPDGDGPASLWGMTIAVRDLDALAVRLGDRLGPVRDAVQPGRRIVTLRRHRGISTAVAFMTPRG